MKKPLLFFVVLCVMMACSKPSPQLPSNKGTHVDERAEGLLIVNKRLAVREDSLLNAFAKNDAALLKNELGFWYKIDKKTNGKVPKEKEKCKFALQVMLLDNKVVMTIEQQIEIGKKQTIVGVEEALKLMHRGESATLILPWYLAYGMLGNQDIVPPYTSIICKVQLYN